MMRSLLHLVKSLFGYAREIYHKSIIERRSESFPGVTFAIRRMSFGRRLELAERIRDLGAELEYHDAGEELRDKIEATLIAGRINRVYLEWGLVEVRGLKIDGQAPTRELLFDAGPEALTREIVDAIKAECGLTAQERKNS